MKNLDLHTDFKDRPKNALPYSALFIRNIDWTACWWAEYLGTCVCVRERDGQGSLRIWCIKDDCVVYRQTMIHSSRRRLHCTDLIQTNGLCHAWTMRRHAQISHGWINRNTEPGNWIYKHIARLVRGSLVTKHCNPCWEKLLKTSQTHSLVTEPDI